MDQPALSPSLYDILGVGESITIDEVRRLRRVLARRYHPDVAPTPDPARLSRILDACDVLGEPSRRAGYDARLARARRQSTRTRRAAATPAPARARRFPWSTMWIQAFAYGLGAATLPGYITAYWVGSDLSPATAQDAPHMLLFDTPVVATLLVQALLTVSAVVLVHTLRYRRTLHERARGR
jgi:curved DNA-binding protein CbpA